MADNIEQPFPPQEDQSGFSGGFNPIAKAAPVTSDDPEETESSHLLPFLIVGIGASAGGVEAYIDLFKNLPSDTGMAFVVVPHLSADQRSYLPEILARHTTMLTVPIETGIRPEPNHVYFLPPNTRVRLERGVFQLEMRGSNGAPHPIDFFFHSLAKDQRNRAIGVVLSGMDSDGALGLKAIKGEGGISMVQSPESARFPDMPRSSISTDHVDLVLPPDQLAHQLALLGQRPQISDLRLLEEGTAPAGEEQSFGRILQLLRGVSGVDFRLYKPNTIHRRIARRMLMRRIDTLANYLALVQGNVKELRELHEDVLINVTRFFRDPEVFEALKNSVLPEIFQDRSLDQQVRIWVAGCSSGEEVYSIAVCLLEFLTGNALEPPIQIFGTDASEQNIQKARAGIYPESITAEVSAERLRRFFVKTEKGYQVSKRVRDLCIFARQNLCHDPPFSRLDLVSCRNVLIYFGSQLQRQTIPTFHYALRPNGILLLGHSETIREFTDLFALRDRKSKIYWKIGATPSRALLDVAPRASFPAEISVPQQTSSAETRGDLELQRAADRIVLARYGPPGVIVNEQFEIVQSRGHTSPFLEIPQGAVTLQLTRMAREDIAPYVSSALQRAVKEDLPVQMERLQVRDGDQTTEITLEVLPIHSVNARSKCYLVLFVPSQGSQAGSGRAAAQIEPPEGDQKDGNLLFAQLQQELSSSKLYLQSLLEERDIKNQDLVSANEEIQSANEELQSTNEELETTKEELQSSNEELQTVNDELNTRNTVLTQTSNDLQNLLNSVNMPVLMLSNELRIRHFAPQTQRLMNLLPVDIGRPFSDIRLNLKVDNLEGLFTEVLDTLGAREIEVQDRDNRWYLLRVRPYRTTDNKIEGLVMVLVDIDQLRRSQQELREARDFAASVIENIPLPLVVVDLDFKIHSTNEAFCALVGSSSQGLERRLLPDLAAALWGTDQPLRSYLENLQKEKDLGKGFMFEHKTPGENSKVFCIRGRVLHPDSVQFLLVTFEDMTVHKEVERLLKAEGERLASEVESTTKELGRSQDELRALTGSLFTSQEEERRRLARELHDDISQRLAAFDLDSNEVLRHLGAGSSLAEQKLQEIRGRMRVLSEDVRRLSHQLHPSTLEDLGLASALRSLTGEFGEREKMITTFSAQELPPAIPIEVATGLYRIAQEALRNVAKHAGKTHVKVLLRGKPEALELQVADSGLGFDTEDKRSGLGLISMEERARLIGATLKIESALGEGTKVTVDVLLSPPA
ncbi:MAG: PAS domain-containing protein [Acidobacteriaceae bacterium]|nr:PAS domain-containing protein [Acidobacteriaceae bacterium]